MVPDLRSPGAHARRKRHAEECRKVDLLPSFFRLIALFAVREKRREFGLRLETTLSAERRQWSRRWSA